MICRKSEPIISGFRYADRLMNCTVVSSGGLVVVVSGVLCEEKGQWSSQGSVSRYSFATLVTVFIEN